MKRAPLGLLAAAALGCGATPPPTTAPPPRAVPAPTAIAAAATSAAPAPTPLPDAVQKLEAMPSRAFDVVRSLTDEVGPRLAGSPGDTLAVAWALRTLPANGLSNVRPERVMVTHWERGAESAEIVAPIRQTLRVVALGGSTATPAAGVEAEVLEVASLEALEALAPNVAAGKIVFLDSVTHRRRDGHGYGENVAGRFRGPGVAASKGAVAFVIRSVGSDHDRLGHTGAKAKDEHEIPAGALTVPDAELLHRILEERGSARVHLVLTPRTLPDAPSANVMGEVRGRERPDEIVVLGAHLDSWDLGTGAIDDGAGCAIVIDAARRIAALSPPPRRTVRVVLFANEEHGLEGGKAYADAHKPEADHTLAAIEADLGADRVFGARFLGAPEAMPRFQAIAAFVEPLGVTADADGAHGGSDISPLRALGVPIIDMRQDASRYFDWHHTANDTLDKIDPAQISQAATAYAVMAWGAAEMDGDLGRVPEEKRSPKR